MAKITLPEITAGYNSATQLNNAFALLEAELQGKVLYRDNPAGEPNTLENAIDMNTNDINNVGNIDTDTITVAGVDLTTKVGEAATSATNAATSASESAASAAAALASELAAAGYLDNFDDKYLGAKASAPTLDNDGDPLTDGALYFNTTSNKMFVYDLGTTAWLALTLTDAELAQVNIVADNIADVSTVAGNSANVTLVADNTTNINAVAADATDIGTVATNISNVNTVAANATNINTVAGIDTEVTQVAADSTEITSVAGSLTSVNTVASNITNVNTVATNNTNVTNVGSNIASVNTVATNISDVITFSDLYLGAYATAPAGTTTGSLYYNTTLDQLYVWNGSAWDQAAFSISGAVTSFNTRTGAVTLASGDVTSALGFTPQDAASAVSAINDLSDVVITTPSNNQILKYNGTNWVNGSDTDTGILYTDLSVTTAAAGSPALAYNNTNGVFTYTPPDLTPYLTTETNDLTAAVTWANVPDANITQTSVTQHQAALSVTESQISNLGTTVVLDSDIGVTVQGYDVDTLKADVADTLTAPFRGTVTTDNDLSFDQNVTNNFSCTPSSGAAFTFTNHTAGQSGYILLDNSAGVAITAAATTKINATDLTTISTAGTYLISYFSTATLAYITVSAAYP